MIRIREINCDNSYTILYDVYNDETGNFEGQVMRELSPDELDALLEIWSVVEYAEHQARGWIPESEPWPEPALEPEPFSSASEAEGEPEPEPDSDPVSDEPAALVVTTTREDSADYGALFFDLDHLGQFEPERD